MRILLDARLYGLEHTGVGRYIKNLVKEIGKIDNNNHYLILLRKNYFSRLKLPKNWEKVLADFRHYTFAEQVKLPGLISKFRPDLVHFPHFNVPIFYQGKYIVTLHDMNMHKQGAEATKLPLPLYFLKRIPYRYVFRSAVEKSLKIVTPSKAVKDEIVSYFGISESKVKVIYEGAPSFKENLKLNVIAKYNLKKSYFLYYGNVYPHKNIEKVISSVVLLNKLLNKRVYLYIASSRSIFTEKLRKFLTEKKLLKYIKLLGFVPDEELPVLLKNSVAFIYPSLSEGFGLQGLEAMAAGTLLLASDIAVFKEIYQDNALYFNPHKASSITRKMEDALNLPVAVRSRMVKKSRKFISRYSWNKMAKQTLELYRSV